MRSDDGRVVDRVRLCCFPGLCSVCRRGIGRGRCCVCVHDGDDDHGSGSGSGSGIVDAGRGLGRVGSDGPSRPGSGESLAGGGGGRPLCWGGGRFEVDAVRACRRERTCWEVMSGPVILRCDKLTRWEIFKSGERKALSVGKWVCGRIRIPWIAQDTPQAQRQRQPCMLPPPPRLTHTPLDVALPLRFYQPRSFRWNSFDHCMITWAIRHPTRFLVRRKKKKWQDSPDSWQLLSWLPRPQRPRATHLC